MQNFMELCLAGKATPDQIEQFVEEWNNNESTQELHLYLGMTEDEYDLWMVEPEKLPGIIQARKKK